MPKLTSVRLVSRARATPERWGTTAQGAQPHRGAWLTHAGVVKIARIPVSVHEARPYAMWRLRHPVGL